MRKKKENGFFAEFKKFITRGNILDMAVGVIVGSAFTAIVTALSNNILKPVINFLIAKILGKDTLSEAYTFLQKVYDVDPETGAVLDTVNLAESIYIDWGTFINAIINFLLIALTLFVIVRIINRVRKGLDIRALLEKEEREKAEAEKAAQEAQAKAEAEKAAQAAAQAEADKKAAEEAAQLRLRENIARQTELLEQIASKMK